MAVLLLPVVLSFECGVTDCRVVDAGGVVNRAQNHRWPCWLSR